MSKALESTLKAWKKETLAALDPVIQKRITQAIYDLWYGPVGDGAYGDVAADDPDGEWSDWPGFVKACAEIGAALKDIPSCLYLDVDAGCWTENEPEPEKCESCDGQGECDYTDLYDTCLNGLELQTRKVRCPDCSGRGGFDPAGDWYKLERHELIQELVGKELAEYVR